MQDFKIIYNILQRAAADSSAARFAKLWFAATADTAHKYSTNMYSCYAAIINNTPSCSELRSKARCDRMV